MARIADAARGKSDRRSLSPLSKKDHDHVRENGQRGGTPVRWEAPLSPRARDEVETRGRKEKRDTYSYERRNEDTGRDRSRRDRDVDSYVAVREGSGRRDYAERELEPRQIDRYRSRDHERRTTGLIDRYCGSAMRPDDERARHANSERERQVDTYFGAAAGAVAEEFDRRHQRTELYEDRGRSRHDDHRSSSSRRSSPPRSRYGDDDRYSDRGRDRRRRDRDEDFRRERPDWRSSGPTRRYNFEERQRRNKGTEEERQVTRTLYVGNIPHDFREEELGGLFDKYGPLTKITLPVDRETGENRGFAFVEFEEKRNAVKALDKFDGQMLDGLKLRLDWDVGSQQHSGRMGGGRQSRSRSPGRG